MKQKFARFFQIIFMLIVCITLSACAGMDPDGDYSDEDLDDYVGGISLDGVKVLRKPLTGYDFEGYTPDNEGQTDYYRHFAQNILTNLFYTYGNFNYYYDTSSGYNNILEQINSVANNENVEKLISDFGTEESHPERDKFLYFYDAIRYQIVKVEPEDYASASQVQVTADLSKGWNWTIPYNQKDYRAFVYSHNGDMKLLQPEIKNAFRLNQFTYSYFTRYYSGENIPGELFDGEANVLSTDDFQSAFINNDTIDALTYAIYCRVLGLKPNKIEIKYVGNATSGETRAFVDGYQDAADASETNGKRSAALALADIKARFKSLGSYVGLTNRDKANIKDFILTEVIGAQATSFNNPKVNYYYEDVVDAIIQYCGTQTTIGEASKNEEGGESEGSTTVGDSFMASEVVNFPHTSFFSSFEGDPFQFVKGPFEYQSFVLMPKGEITISDIWLDFKYDAGKDGDDIVTDAALDIEVSVRWNKGDGSPIREVKKTINVKDGPADVGEDGTTLEFELDTADAFGEVVKIGKFQEPEALQPKEEDGRVVTLTGFSDARRYYKVLESARYGGYGVLDSNRIEGSYLEVAFNVNKAPGDTTTNYAFYVAISNLFEPPSYPNDPEWH